MSALATRIVLFAALSCLPLSPAFGLERSNDTSAIGALSALQQSQRESADALVDQAELDVLIHSGGGGACPSAAAIDAIQAIRVMSGLDRLKNPHKAVLAAFTNDKKLLDGRLTNEQFVNLLRFYERSYLEGHTFTVDVDLPPLSSYSPGGRIWSATNGPDLRVDHGRLKIVTFNVT